MASLVRLLIAVDRAALVLARAWFGKGHPGVVADKQVQPAVAVIVDPCGACGPFAGIGHTGLLCPFRKRSITVVVKQSACRKPRYVQVFQSVVVIVRRSDTHSVERDARNSSALRHVLELVVSQIVVK